MDDRSEQKPTHPRWNLAVRLSAALGYAYLAAQMFTGVESFYSDAVGYLNTGPEESWPNLIPSASIDAITWGAVGSAVWVGIAFTSLLVFASLRLGVFAALGMTAAFVLETLMWISGALGVLLILGIVITFVVDTFHLVRHDDSDNLRRRLAFTAWPTGLALAFLLLFAFHAIWPTPTSILIG